MINAAINNLKRACSKLEDIPEHLKTEKQKVVSSLNDIFEDFHDQFEDKETLKKMSKLREDVMEEIEKFCNRVSAELEEDISIVEE